MQIKIARFCESQNLGKELCEAPKTKFLLLFAFAKRRVLINFTNSNLPNKVDCNADSANRRI